MKKFWSIFFVFILGLYLYFFQSKQVVLGVSSQEFQQAYQGYINTSSIYQSDYEKFILSRSKYLTFKSISSESEAVDSTKKMIISRIDFLVKYLTALRIKLALETKIIDYQENLLYLRLDNEQTSLLNNKELVNSAQDLKSLIEIESNSGEKFQTIKKLAYKSLGLINYHQTLKMMTDLRKQIDLLKNKLEQYSSLETYDLSSSKKRLEQTDEQFQSLERKIEEERKVFFSRVDSQKDPEKPYLEFKDLITTLNTETLNLFPSFEEIIFLIKKT